jgi:phage protein U
MMLALGLFVFSIHTVAYQEFQRSMQWRHPSNSRVGARPAYQYIGPGEETITLPGWIATELIGTPLSLMVIEQMANTGKAYTLISGLGLVHGVFVIEQMTETKSVFFSNGAARRIDFTISLKRIDDSLVDKMLGDLKIPDIGSLL